jgi:uncharacterized membrane protein YjfL (UPF0719 family)
MIFVLIISFAMRIFSRLTPGMNEMEELKNGNVAVALLMVSFVLSVSGVVIAVLLK